MREYLKEAQLRERGKEKKQSAALEVSTPKSEWREIFPLLLTIKAPLFGY